MSSIPKKQLLMYLHKLITFKEMQVIILLPLAKIQDLLE